MCILFPDRPVASRASSLSGPARQLLALDALSEWPDQGMVYAQALRGCCREDDNLISPREAGEPDRFESGLQPRPMLLVQRCFQRRFPRSEMT